MPIYSRGQHSLLFLHIPKTGGTSIDTALRGVANRQFYHNGIPPGLSCPPQHLHFDVLSRLFDLDGFHGRMAVIRHPVDRLVSEFKMRTALRNQTMSFEAWANRALDRAAGDPWYLHNHFRPQAAFIGPGVSVFRFEKGLAAPLAHGAACLGCETAPVLGWCQRGRHGETRVTMRLMDRITTVYAEDFATFGYDPADARVTIEPAPGLSRRLRWHAERMVARPDKKKRRPQ